MRAVDMAARVRGFWLKRRATSRRLAPRRNNERNSKSVLTVESADSILATRDWLDPNRSATCVCVKPKCSRQRRNPAANASFVSMNRRSSSDRFRKSPASPTDHPARSNRCRLSLRMVLTLLRSRQALVLGQTTSTSGNNRLRRRRRLFLEDIENHDRVGCDVVHDSASSAWRRRCAVRGTQCPRSASVSTAAVRASYRVATDAAGTRLRGEPSGRMVAF